ncbi:YppE family protein [Bacillus sp. V3B]|uniref:YppE family protein n=1 Tax=Bacillus sp. V3B TaxID=2804915 RepID=UPI00210A3880|nr:YppE family protein [Bacillus sp. V3B]MCQ6273918.1 YppE family protein [Bacillus sp. V3B]
MKNQELIYLTKKLLGYHGEILKKFEATKEAKIEGDFFQEVRPFSNEVKDIMDQWLVEVIAWINTCRPRNIHAQQMDSVVEQLGMIAVQAFFPQTSRTRFINTAQSVEYVLTAVLLETEKDQIES